LVTALLSVQLYQRGGDRGPLTIDCGQTAGQGREAISYVVFGRHDEA
jgi:hypothetical protein